MNKICFFYFSYITIILSACSSKYKIEGDTNLSTINGSNIYIKTYSNKRWHVVDSAQIIHGTFALEGKLHSKKPKNATVFMDKTPLTPIILEPGDLKIELNRTSLSISGTPLNDKLYSFYRQNKLLEHTLREQNTRSFAQLNAKDITLYQRSIKDFIIENNDNILSYTVYTIYKEEFPAIAKDKEIASILKTPNKGESTFHKDYHTYQKSREDLTFYPTNYLLW